VFVGIEKLSADAYTYENGTLTITDVTGLPVGETYATVLTSAVAQAEPLIIATSVFDEMKDFETFLYIKQNVDNGGEGKVSATIQDGIDASKCVHDGYYVLANDITNVNDTRYYIYNNEIKDGVNDKASDNTDWRGVTQFIGKELGLTGTFNGLGHKVSDICMEHGASGLFELINGGTVKNLALTNFIAYSKSNRLGALAFMAIDPVIENVYIEIPSNYRGSVAQCEMFYYLHQTEAESAQLRNVFLNVSYNTTYIGNTNGLFATMHGQSKKEIAWENVYSVSNAGLGYYATDTDDDDVADTLTGYAYGDNQKTESGYIIYEPKGAVSTTYTTATNAYYCQGARQYFTMDAFKADEANYDLSAFVNDGGNCWKIEGGVPVFGYTAE